MIILFDGLCNFCDASVQLIIKNDPKGKFRFASLQSDIGQKMVQEYNVPSGMDSIILIEKNRAYFKSAAALRICSNLTGFWKLFYPFIIVPAPIRDLIYSFLAKNRYKWFGRKDSCMLPPPDVRRRFLS